MDGTAQNGAIEFDVCHWIGFSRGVPVKLYRLALKI